MKKLLLLSALLASFSLSAAPDDIGATEVATWEGNAKACFLMMFDDGWPSALVVAIPELEKRNLAATYFLVPEKGEYKVYEEKWKKVAGKPGVVFGVHTLTHHGIKDLEHGRHEIGDCAKYLRDIVPGKRTRLLAYGQPGVGQGKWNITGDEEKQLLKEFDLVDRPPFRDHGAVYHWQTCEQMLALADKAIETGGMNYVIFHGLEIKDPKRTYQDFWAMKQDIVFPFFDAIAERRDRGDLWVTDWISCHQYETERATARVENIVPGKKGITLTLSCDADPALYDLPLTLRTRVPKDWEKVSVTQGERTEQVDAKDGVVQYHAVPDGTSIALARSTER